MNDNMKEAWAKKHTPSPITLYSYGITEKMLEAFLYQGVHEDAFATHCEGTKPNFETEWGFELGPDGVVYKVRFIVVFRVKGQKSIRVTIPREHSIWQTLFNCNNALAGLADIHQPYPSAAR